MIRLQWARLTRAQLKSCCMLYLYVIVGDPLEREKASEMEKTNKNNIAASSDNQGSRILRPKVVCF